MSEHKGCPNSCYLAGRCACGSEQMSLDLKPAPLRPAVGETIDERFASFHALNPWLFHALIRLTEQQLAAGQRRVGIGMLFEVLRWQHSLSTIGDPWRLNNNYRSRYVRLLIAERPEWASVFETRELRAA